MTTKPTGGQKSKLTDTHPRVIANLCLFILALTFLAHVQVDNEFKAINQIFSIKKFDKPEISFLLEKEESFQIQVAHRFTEKKPITANLTLFINDKKAIELQVNGTGTQKRKFAVSQSFFMKGENRIAWELTSSQPGVFVDEIKLTNYVGINPNIPIAWVVPDEFLSQNSTRGAYQFLTVLFCVTLAVALYVSLNRLLFYNTLQESLSACRKFLFAPNLALCAILVYSIFTPQKLLFPTETTFWMILICSLAIQLPSILVTSARGESSSLKITAITLTVICLISILAHLSFFRNAWYVQDDYLSIHWGLGNPNIPIKHVNIEPREGGTIDPILKSTKGIVNLLYTGQGRYQPVRLFIFMIFMHFFQEEHSPYYNFALHLANLTLLFLILRKFKLEPVAILISILLFSLYGRWRMMESPSTMIAGSGLNLFLISLTALFLIKALEQENNPKKKTAFFCISWFAYFCLVFSYEVAFPLILPIIYVFYIFSQKTEVGQESNLPQSGFAIRCLTGFFKRKHIFYLSPYFILLIVYLLFFNLTHKGEYPGTSLSWSFSDVWTRLLNYMSYTISLRINLNHLGMTDIIILFLYYAVAIMAVRSEKSSLQAETQKNINWKTILFGLAMHFSSIILFVLNRWESPNNLMIHHIYMMTAGASILAVALLFQAQWFLPGATYLAKSNSKRVFGTIFLRNHYRNFLIFIFFPLVLVSEGGYLSRYYTNHNVGIVCIKPIKTATQKYIDPEKTDAIIFKNFYHNYHGMSSLEGAFMHWLHLNNKIIASGRPILSVEDDKIKFMRPLGNYWVTPNISHETQNNRTQILFLENDTVLPYHDFIHFEEGTNLYQTQHVWGDQEPEEFRHYRLDAILKNTNKDFLEIKTKSEEELEKLISNTTRLELNGKLIPQALTSGKSLFIDITSAKATSNYFFLTLVSTDANFKKHLLLIRLQNPEGKTVSRDIENIPIGADSWGIG